jgi:hypothetical protein
MFSGFFCKAPLQQSMELHCSLRGLNLFIFLSFVSFCHSVAFWKLLFLFFCKVLTSLSFGLDGAANFHEVKRRRDRKKEGGANKESADLRARPGSGGSNPTRGGRGGGGRGHSVARLSSQGMHSAGVILSLFSLDCELQSRTPQKL